MQPELPDSFIEELQVLLARYGYVRTEATEDQPPDTPADTLKGEAASDHPTEATGHPNHPPATARAERAARLLKLMKKPR